MSITESIIEWMQGYPGGVSIMDNIGVDQLAVVHESMGIFKSPGDEVVEYIGGARDVTSHFLFLICQPSQTNAMRMENQQWLEDFEKWVRDQNRVRNIPRLSTGRECGMIYVSNSFAIQQQSDSETIYQITVTINYFEEG